MWQIGHQIWQQSQRYITHIWTHSLYSYLNIKYHLCLLVILCRLLSLILCNPSKCNLFLNYQKNGDDKFFMAKETLKKGFIAELDCVARRLTCHEPRSRRPAPILGWWLWTTGASNKKIYKRECHIEEDKNPNVFCCSFFHNVFLMVVMESETHNFASFDSNIECTGLILSLFPSTDFSEGAVSLGSCVRDTESSASCFHHSW